MKSNRENKRAKARLARAAAHGKRIERALCVAGRPATAGYPLNEHLYVCLTVTKFIKSSSLISAPNPGFLNKLAGVG